MNDVTFIVLFLSNSVFTRIPTFYRLLVRAKNPSGTINFKIIQNATEARKCLSVIFLHLNSEVLPHTFVLRGYILLAKPSPCFLVYVALFRDGKFLLFVIKYED